MTRCKASFLSGLCFGLYCVLLPCAVEAILIDSCPDEARIILSSEERRNETRLVSTPEFDESPPHLTWLANGSTYGCICDLFSCLRLCCPRGSVRKNATCGPTDGDFFDEWLSIYFRNLTLKPDEGFSPIVGKLRSEGYFLNLSGAGCPEDEFRLSDDEWSIQLVKDNSTTDRYCLEPRSYVLSGLVQVAAIVFSIPFLLVTFIVYVLFPELNTHHGLTIRCYVASLGVSLIFLVTDRLASFKDSIWLCRFIGLGIHFPTIASCMWLNVMAIDMWYLFGSRNTFYIVDDVQKSRKFLLNSIYAWGLASIFSGICIFMELVPGLPKDLIRPDIASSNRCWFASWKAEIAYFYGPFTIIVICNVFMCVATAMKMMWNRGNHRYDAKKWFILYIKLFIVVSIKWTMEVISWWWREADFKYIWYTTDAVNGLQGFVIFLILVWERKDILSSKKLFKKADRRREDNELYVDYSSMNSFRRINNDVSNDEMAEFNDTFTSESIFSSNIHGFSSLKNIVEARDYD